ncbi:MAG: protein kinase [Terrestrivirus sp.]|uniref:Protein kinase n=1 Tax=Terrestrivirus sp. TaxID=2487775 RepID=A0A3G4ZS14_9VIRU|nr:MAG: protein kinase [Terrestrivirus sp.]
MNGKNNGVKNNESGSKNLNITHNETYNYLKSASKIKWCLLDKIIEKTIEENPYRKNSYKYQMWREQCMVNFPILYLSSIYLYMYAKQRNIDTFLFATRDCCHFYKIFSKLFPNEKSHYFNCSRVMFEGATSQENIFFNNYVKSLIDENSSVEKSIYVDIHGTGKRVFSYFEKQFDAVPHCFMLSATHKKYGKFPEITQTYVKKNKFVNIVFNARGGPIEMLNYELMGTLRDYTENGPVRDLLEYDINVVKPYHGAMSKIFDNIKQFTELIDYDKDDCNKHLAILDKVINKLFVSIQNDLPIISEFISHASNHRTVGDNNITTKADYNKVKFNKIISTNTVHGIIWDGEYNGRLCIIKIVSISQNDKRVNASDEFTLIDDNYHEENTNYNDFFMDKKQMDYDTFMVEAKGLTGLSKVKMGPDFFGYYTQGFTGTGDDNTKSLYGFLIMEKIDCSVKQILIERSTNHEENKFIDNAIRKLHNEYGIVHGDLKPSNIGIILNNNGTVKKCVFFDCPKIKYQKDYEKKEFNKLKEKDIKNYKKHVIKNLIEGKNKKIE